MPIAPPQRSKELKVRKPDVEAPKRAQSAKPAVEPETEALALPSWQTLAKVEPAAGPAIAPSAALAKSAPRAERIDPVAQSQADAARASGHSEGMPGPKRGSELRDQAAEAEQAEREGREPTQADAIAQGPPEAAG